MDEQRLPSGIFVTLLFLAALLLMEVYGIELPRPSGLLGVRCTSARIAG